MEGFVLIDVSDETAPAGIGSFFLDGYACDVVTARTIAYTTDSPSGLYVFDLSRPGMPEPIGVIHAPAAPRDIEVSVGMRSRPTLIVGPAGETCCTSRFVAAAWSRHAIWTRTRCWISATTGRSAPSRLSTR